MAYASTMTSLRSTRTAAIFSVLALSLSLVACAGSDSGGSSPAPASLQAEQLSLELESAIDQDNTTAFSQQLQARWNELEPKAAQDELTTSSDINADGGVVSIAGGGVTCTVTVVNEPPAVNRVCEGG
jgi:hypothetical protein